MRILNFGHPFAPGVLDQIQERAGESCDVIQVRTQADQEKGFAEQARRLVDSVGLRPDEWQTERFLVCPPGLAPLAVCVLADVHGRCGYFPACLRLKPVAGASPPQFVFAEILDLHLLRNTTRELRFS